MEALLHVCETFGTAAGTEDLTSLFSRHLAGLGFQKFAYFNLRQYQGAPVLLSTYPREWVDHYADEGYYSVDPVIQNCRSSAIPFAWGRGTRTARGRGRCRTLFQEAAEWGITVGLTVPVHAPHGSWAAVTVASGERDPAFLRSIDENRPLLQFMAGYYHSAAEALCFPSRQAAPVRLTPREGECLRWTALGKSAWEIASILRISESTVTGYLESSKRKLGVFSKSHAVVKAIMEGFITV